MSFSDGMTKQWWEFGRARLFPKVCGWNSSCSQRAGTWLIHPCIPLLLAASSPLFHPSSPWSSLALHSFESGSYALASSAPSIAYLFALLHEQLCSWALTSIAQLGVCVCGGGAEDIQLCQMGISTYYQTMIFQNYFVCFICRTKIILDIPFALFWNRVLWCSSGWPGVLYAEQAILKLTKTGFCLPPEGIKGMHYIKGMTITLIPISHIRKLKTHFFEYCVVSKS